MLKKLIGGYMPPYKDKNGNLVLGSLSIMEKITVGGVDQWITIRGRNEDQPILLFLHGGPGCSQAGALQKFNGELEDHYIVVNWDQRGAGKSYTREATAQPLSMNQLLEDAYELVLYLLSKFKKNKIFLMGHSVGSALGLLFAHRYPNLLYAYIGINQPIHRQEEEKKSYDFALQIAKDKQNQKAINQLKKIGFPNNGVYKNVNDLVIQRKWLTKFNGVTCKKNATAINLKCLLSPHLNLKEKLSYLKGMSFSMGHLWGEVTSLNFFELVLEVEIPIFFIVGKHDRIVFADLVEKYYHFVKAESKRFINFSNSGHLACFEEPEEFNQVMIKQVLPICFQT